MGKFANGVLSSVLVTIKVQDVNDECPTFTRALYIVKHTEPIHPGLIVALSDAIDIDTVGTLTYSISGDSRFSINEKGEITTNIQIETTNRNTTTIPLNVHVTDGKCNDKANVSIVVNTLLLDSYLFPKPFYEYTFSESINVPHFVGTFVNSYHNATYTMVGTDTFFSIEPQSGKSYFIHSNSILSSNHSVKLLCGVKNGMFWDLVGYSCIACSTSFWLVNFQWFISKIFNLLFLNGNLFRSRKEIMAKLFVEPDMYPIFM